MGKIEVCLKPCGDCLVLLELSLNLTLFSGQ